MQRWADEHNTESIDWKRGNQGNVRGEMMERLTEWIDDGESKFAVSRLDNTKITNGLCLNKLAKYEDLEEQGLLLKLPCKKGDTVYDLVCCTDGRWRIFKMKVCVVNAFGGMHNLNGHVWNVYLEDDYSKDYVSFYDFGKTVFLTQIEAEEALREREAEK